jgi:hypothetical protein
MGLDQYQRRPCSLLSRLARTRGFVALRQTFARFAHLRRQGQAQNCEWLTTALLYTKPRGQRKSPGPCRNTGTRRGRYMRRDLTAVTAQMKLAIQPMNVQPNTKLSTKIAIDW